MANLLDFKPLSGTWRNANDFSNVGVLQVTGPGGIRALLYTCHINIDYDGASTAYGPPEKVTLDNLGNAGFPVWYSGLFALHPDAHTGDMNDNSPATFVIGKSGPLATAYFKVKLDKRFPDSKGRCPIIGENGYYVSSSSKRRPGVGFNDMYKQSSYVDASTIPFGALADNLASMGSVALDDCGLAVRYNMAKHSPFYFADTPAPGQKVDRVGECSYALFLEVGGEPKTPTQNPSNSFPVSFLVFPRSKTGGDQTAMTAAIRAQFQLMNGTDNYKELPLLMAFAGEAHDGTSGLIQLNNYRRKSADEKRGLMPPPGYHNIVRALRTYGYNLPPVARPGPQPVPSD